MRRFALAARLLAVVGAAGSIALVLPAPFARAQATSVTLEASATSITIGDDVTLTVQIDPPSGGEGVSIVDGDGTVVASGTTGNQGRFTKTISPRSNETLHAVWGTDVSADVAIGVRAKVRVAMGAVRLFDTVAVSGSVRPIVPGAHVDVVLSAGGKVVAEKHPAMGSAGGFRTRFPVAEPGTYRAHARYGDPAHRAGTDVAGPRATPLPTLGEGSHGVYVRLLERRLVALGYHLAGVNDAFDFRTADAVMAFRKVQRMRRNHVVDAGVWRALADPMRLHPHARSGGLHIEVDQTRQVLFTVRDGKVAAIIHVSTGKPSTPTHDGSFFVSRKIAGYSAHQLYYPSFFDGNRAIHGWPDVPSYAASHGCVRVPYWTAKWIFGLADIGTPVLVYH
jgi:L,D-transpeptidase catalytic domain